MNPKITDLVCEEDVVRVQVPVDDRMRKGVKVIHSSGDIQGNVQLRHDVQRPLLLVQHAEKGSSCYVLGHYRELLQQGELKRHKNKCPRKWDS